jgi:hypothetical protein
LPATKTTDISTATAPDIPDFSTTQWKAHPFIHLGPDRFYHPLTDVTLLQGEKGYYELQQVLSGSGGVDHLPAEVLSLLVEDQWLVGSKVDVSTQYLLKYVSLEAHTVCNQSCYFCPVSLDPREDHFMPTEQYLDILQQLKAYRDTIEAVFMISYNEPTADKRFVEQVRAIRDAGLPPATLTNGTGLTPKRVDQLLEIGGLRFLSINLSTLDRERYSKDRGGDHLELVLKNLDYAKDKALADEMAIVVLGTGDDQHKADYEEIKVRFSGSRFDARYYVVNDRAAYLQIGIGVGGHKRQKLRGCEYVGSRPLQHLHITPRAKAILCCQDYSETAEVGDLNIQTVAEVLSGPGLAEMRRWAYGIEEAPANFICRNCPMAITYDE